MIGRYRRITATTDDGVVLAAPCTLVRVVIGTEVAAQTLSIHDCAVEGDAAAGNKVATVKLDTRGSFEFDVRLNTGLTALVSGGTSDITVVYG